ncbi:DUF4422 domain-containing protein [Floricoccus penangensis]|uniref:DUF4422 domain-containing protein n=1 Tax=Floricoccus penangensis TaxID=1859475 RepID=UPI002041A8BB|nr:DUF4422 domain-containing protein [Floricoccus penangensis]URZ87624.1 DUF4422 domain-containing protein [Floricoccus penangensis]
MDKSITIGIATHKNYKFPKDEIYHPIFVGADKNGNVNWAENDNEFEDNISILNPYFCELTAIYHLWKNNNSDYKGLVHYRRHFYNGERFSEFKTGTFDKILNEKMIRKFFDTYDAILPKKREYHIETLYSHYDHSHQVKDLDMTRDIIVEKYPDYACSFDDVMNRTSAHMFNMFIMNKKDFNNYCNWMFDILFELQNRIDISEYDVQESRVFGYISELLLDVWLERNPINYKELPVMFMEKQNWLKKGGKFIINKFKNKKV